MEVLVFLVTAAVAVAAAITMVLQRNAMYSALFLVLNFFCLAVLYVLLQAYFVAVVQVAVYAGAIMVLMLFVIMLLNVAQPEPRDNRLGFLRPFGVIAAVVLAIELGAVIARGAMPPAAPAARRAPGGAGDARCGRRPPWWPRSRRRSPGPARPASGTPSSWRPTSSPSSSSPSR